MALMKNTFSFLLIVVVCISQLHSDSSIFIFLMSNSWTTTVCFIACFFYPKVFYANFPYTTSAPSSNKTTNNEKIIGLKALNTKILVNDDVDSITNDLRTMGVRQKTINSLYQILVKYLVRESMNQIFAVVWKSNICSLT